MLVRISSVGYSRHNEELQKMHEDIASGLTNAISGIRFSFTPYTFGFTKTGESTGSTKRNEFIADFANMIRIYRPVSEQLGIGTDSFCVDIRFKPLAKSEKEQLVDEQIKDHHVIRFGSYLLVSLEKQSQIPTSKVQQIDGRKSIFSEDAKKYVLLVSDKQIENGDWRNLAEYAIGLSEDTSAENDELMPLKGFEDSVLIKTCNLYKFENRDGQYYAIDPTFKDEGTFIAKHFYSRTEKRLKSGYLDAERYMLNSILAYKKKKGLGRRDSFDSATWTDINQAITIIKDRQQFLERYDKGTSQHIKDEILSMVEAYRIALELADYPPAYFFDRRFTNDTGIIVNQGRAIGQFLRLATEEDMPLTPHEERGYGEVSFSTKRGHVWRWSPKPTLIGEEQREMEFTLHGKKNSYSTEPTISVSELDWHNLSPHEPNGIQLREIDVHGVPLESIRISEGEEKFLFPGIKIKP